MDKIVPFSGKISSMSVSSAIKNSWAPTLIQKKDIKLMLGHKFC